MTDVKVQALPSAGDDGIRFFALTPALTAEADAPPADPGPDPDATAEVSPTEDPEPHLTSATSGAITWYALPAPEVEAAAGDLPVRGSDGTVLPDDLHGPGPVAEIPHACEPERGASSTGAPGSRGPRLAGVDAARGLALLGMMAVHIVSAETDEGTMSTAWAVAAGKSAALFAVLAGIGIAFTTGRTVVLHGRRRVAASVALTVRALLIGCIGLLLGSVVPFDTAGVILAYYAVLFLLAIPLLGLSVRWLVVLTAVTAVAVPVLSHLARSRMPAPELANPTLADLLDAPGALVTELTLTGLYPALPWLAYVCAGLAIGRSPLTSRGFVLGLTATGVGVAWLSSAASWLLMGRLGGRDRLAEVSTGTMPFDEFTGLFVWGADGTLPTTSAWWLAVLAPHTTTPLDLLHTIGVATAVIGAAIVLGWMAGPVLRPLTAAGSMPLTLYTLHLLLLVAPGMPEGEGTAFLLQVVLLLGFATVWSRRFGRGPLEHAVQLVTGPVRATILAGEGDGRARQATA